MGLVTLAEVLEGRDPTELRPPPQAWWDGRCWELTCVLERTAVLVNSEERLLKRHGQVLVEEQEVEWQTAGGEMAARSRARLRGRANSKPGRPAASWRRGGFNQEQGLSSAEIAARRKASDRRARRDQAKGESAA